MRLFPGWKLRRSIAVLSAIVLIERSWLLEVLGMKAAWGATVYLAWVYLRDRASFHLMTLLLKSSVLMR